MKKRKKAEDSATAQAKAAQQHTRLALEGDETIAAIGVDAFLPPSTYTIPVKFPSGVPFAALAFGSCDNDQVTNPISAFLSKRPEMENAKNYGRATELETRWDEEAKEVGSLFSAAKKELKQRKGEPVKHNYLHDENLKKRASDLVNKADDELRRVRKAAENAEAAAIKRLDEMNGENMDDDLGTDESMEAGTETESLEANPLACAEALPAPKKPKLSKESVRELTILAYQDEAMLRELACMVREKTLKLSKIRKERNERVI